MKLRAESMGEQMFGGGHKVTLSEVPKKGGYFTKDHFEVFIDSKIY